MVRVPLLLLAAMLCVTQKSQAVKKYVLLSVFIVKSFFLKRGIHEEVEGTQLFLQLISVPC
jgi:hypothetical protein